MPRTRLRQTLEELERELEKTEAVDARSRALLDEAMRDVRAVLEDTEAPEAGDRSVLDRLGDRLSEATQHFEESHPAIAETVGRLAAALSNLGI